MTNENLSNSTNNLIDKELRDLILKYMEACNGGEYSLAETILQDIKEYEKSINMEADD